MVEHLLAHAKENLSDLKDQSANDFKGEDMKTYEKYLGEAEPEYLKKGYKKAQVKKWTKVLQDGIKAISNVISNVPMTQNEREKELKGAKLFMSKLIDRLEKDCE